jgi:phenol 2-monooxygenase
MQYFLNGYRKGDPRIRPAADGRTDDQPDLPGEVDVLIVGTGPSGLLLAAQLSEFPDIVTRVVERAPGPLEVGRADGVNCRTVETFESFGLAERMLAEAYWVNQTNFWGPDPDDPTRIKRFGRVQDVRDGSPSSRTSSSTRPGSGTSSWSTPRTLRAASRSTTATRSSRCRPRRPTTSRFW